jgi:hypothetical protein
VPAVSSQRQLVNTVLPQFLNTVRKKIVRRKAPQLAAGFQIPDFESPVFGRGDSTPVRSQGDIMNSLGMTR